MAVIISLFSPSQEVLIIEPSRVDYSQQRDSQIKLEEMAKWTDAQTTTEKHKNHGKARWCNPYLPATEDKDKEMGKARQDFKDLLGRNHQPSQRRY